MLTVMHGHDTPTGAAPADSAGAATVAPRRPCSLPAWGETDSATLVCRQVQDVTHDVKTFLFVPE